MMYIIYNHDGSIKEKNLTDYIQQGDNLTKEIAVAIIGYEPSAFALSAVFKLPNGDQEVLTSDTPVLIKEEYPGIVLSLTEDVTALEGVVKMTIRAIENETDKTLTTYVAYLTINEGAEPGVVAMMSLEQYELLISMIHGYIKTNETILVLNHAPTSAEGFALGQIVYNITNYKLYELKDNGWDDIFDLTDHYTIDEIDGLLADKQDLLTEESLPTAQLEYAIGFDEQGNLRKGQGGGGGAIYNAGTGIDITNFTISIDDTVVATKSFVNSSIATETATFRGTYNVVTDLGLTTEATEQQIASAIATKLSQLGITYDKNDYVYIAFPNATVSTQFDKYDRYKYSGSAWEYEYTLNNSSFTAEQWAAINSGITSGLLSQLARESEIAPTYSSSSTYGYGDLVLYNGQLYRCKTTISTAEAWDSSHWTLVNVPLAPLDQAFNVINASDIVNNTLTQAQYDLITNGKMTLIKGRINSKDNVVLFPAVLSSGSSWQTLGMCYYHQGSDWNISTYLLDVRNLSITLYDSAFSAYGMNVRIKGKTFPNYPTTNADRQYLSIAANGGNLSWEDMTAITTGTAGGATSIQLKTWVGTQAQYDSITTKDANTQYIII